jgi:hypothetical protein
MSLKYWGATDAQVTAYQQSMTTPVAVSDFNSPPMTDIPVKYSAASALEQIITQKWLALFPDGVEAWADYRRTELPKLYPVINSDNPDVPPSDIMRRVGFVPGEYNTNGTELTKGITMLGGADKANTRLWWNPAK